MHPKNDVRKKIFVVATPITLSAMSWMVEIWTPEKHQKCDPQKGFGEPPIIPATLEHDPDPNSRPRPRP